MTIKEHFESDYPLIKAKFASLGLNSKSSGLEVDANLSFQHFSCQKTNTNKQGISMFNLTNEEQFESDSPFIKAKFAPLELKLNS